MGRKPELHGRKSVFLLNSPALEEQMGSTINTANIAVVITAALLFSAPISSRAETQIAQTVTTPGSGRFKRCWDLLLNKNCISHHVLLPRRVTAGDRIGLDYGSNPKHYRFQVVRIIRYPDGRCVLEGSSVLLEKREKIELKNCLPAPDDDAKAADSQDRSYVK